MPDSPRPRGITHNYEGEEVEPEDPAPKTMRRIEEAPTEQGQFSATWQTIKLRGKWK